MPVRTSKATENKKLVSPNQVSPKRSESSDLLQFKDNRTENSEQQKMQEMANESHQVSQLRSYQAMANQSPQVQKLTQLQQISDGFTSSQPSPIQQKTNTQTPKENNNTGLPNALKTGMEQLSGISLNDVNVHRNSDKPAQLQAHAYAQGTNIHLGPGQEKHLPHEAWHVVQQKQGRVKPTVQLKGSVPVNDDVGLETEADMMGAKAASLGSTLQKKSDVRTLKSLSSGSAISEGPVQGYFKIHNGAGMDKTNDASVWAPIGQEKVQAENIWDPLKLDVLTRLGGDDPSPEEKEILEVFVTENKETLLENALSDEKKSLMPFLRILIRAFKAKRALEAKTNAANEAAETPVGERPSPSGLLGGAPSLADPDKPKHTRATYRFTKPEGEAEEESGVNTLGVSLDDYTKARAKSAATAKAAPTLGYTAEQLKNYIGLWNCSTSLIQFLAPFIFRHLGKNPDGRKWEAIVREYARIADEERASESQNASIGIRSRAGASITLLRSAFEKPAREKLKSVLMSGTDVPTNNDGVYFFDALIREKMLADGHRDLLVNPDGNENTRFELNTDRIQQSGQDIGMTMVHWRTILYFDWVLAADLKIAATPEEVEEV